MSAYTTTEITRTAARQHVIAKVMLTVNDETLERLVDELTFDQRLRRCKIVDDNQENQDEIL